MLNLRRRVNESVVIANGAIVVTVMQLRGNWVELGFEAAKDIPIDRKERREAIEAAAMKGGLDGPH